MDGSREQFSAKPDGYLLLGPEVPRIRCWRAVAAGRNDMHPEDLMKADMLSEIVLFTFAALILASMVLFVATMVAQS
jgi:hypothetical protein